MENHEDLARRFEKDIWLQKPSLKAKVTGSFKSGMHFQSGKFRLVTYGHARNYSITITDLSQQKNILGFATNKDGSLRTTAKLCTDQEAVEALNWLAINKQAILDGLKHDPHFQYI